MCSAALRLGLQSGLGIMNDTTKNANLSKAFLGFAFFVNFVLLLELEPPRGQRKERDCVGQHDA